MLHEWLYCYICLEDVQCQVSWLCFRYFRSCVYFRVCRNLLRFIGDMCFVSSTWMDRFVLGSSPYGPDAPRPYGPLCPIIWYQLRGALFYLPLGVPSKGALSMFPDRIPMSRDTPSPEPLVYLFIHSFIHSCMSSGVPKKDPSYIWGKT